MSEDLTRQSERLLSEGRALVRDNQAGGRHRQTASIGQGSASLKSRNLMRRAGFFGAALLAILGGVVTAGLVLGGIGFTGIVIAFFAVVAAAILFANFPKVKVPKRADLTKTQDARKLVARTELWLEHQRPALPPPAIRVVEDIGVQLDALGKQLDHVEASHPAAAETRKLVGELLPETVEAYARIPAHMRREKNGNQSPDEQVTESLTTISREIEQVTRQLAEGSLDDLAIRSRFLEYRYGTGAVPSLAAPDAAPRPE